MSEITAIYDIVPLPGRPVKLTKDIIESIAINIRKGLSREDAIALSGVSLRTFYLYLARGKRIRSSLENGMNEHDLEHMDVLGLHLLQAVSVAEPLQKQALIQKLIDASEKPQHWTAAAWLLERKYPNEFGRMVKIDVDYRSEARDKGIDIDEMLESMVGEMVKKMEEMAQGGNIEDAKFVDVDG